MEELDGQELVLVHLLFRPLRRPHFPRSEVDEEPTRLRVENPLNSLEHCHGDFLLHGLLPGSARSYIRPNGTGRCSSVSLHFVRTLNKADL